MLVIIRFFLCDVKHVDTIV